jgi:hypothetical protein
LLKSQIVIMSSASPTIGYTALTQNDKGLLISGASLPAIRANSVYKNMGYGLLNESGAVVTAETNWWGHPSGPYDPSNNGSDPTHLYNPQGRGDKVSDYVDYEPWSRLPMASPSLTVSDTVFFSDPGVKPKVTVMIGTPMQLAVPLECELGAANAEFVGSISPLTDADADTLWTGIISSGTNVGTTQMVTVTVTSGTCPFASLPVAEVTLIAPTGRVYDAETNAGIAGAKVTLYKYDTSQGSYSIWDGYPFGQVNPQLTSTDGHFAWQPPAGRYYVQAHKDGYMDNQTTPVDASALRNIEISQNKVVAVSSVSIEEPSPCRVGVGCGFVARTNPITVTLPVTYRWESAGQPSFLQINGVTSTNTITWTTPGSKNILVTAWNLAGVVTATHGLTVYAPLSLVSVERASSCRINTDCNFTARVSPTTATPPITYLWQSTDHPDFEVSDGVSNTYSLRWTTPGVKSVTVTARNAVSQVSK